ncbi:MAG: hypothetical protein P8N14_06920 [Sulfitobacter sp.]|nr:hypothetical protein [Sulfitobacter sp.]
MNLTPLLTASAVIQIHTALAVLAVLLTIAIFLHPARQPRA